MKRHTESPRSHARSNFRYSRCARAFVASRASSRAFARPLARASSSRAHRPARALEKHKRGGARTRACEACPPGSEKDVYEAYFQYAAVWAFGGCFGADKANDFRKMFSEWWRAEWGKTSFKFPDEGLVFDYYVELKSDGSGKVEGKHWKERVPRYTHATGEGASFSDIVVPTMDTTRIGYIANMMLKLKKPVMLVGNAGSAKTTIIADKLANLADELMSFNISFNAYTDAATLQAAASPHPLHHPLSSRTRARRSGRRGRSSPN